MSANLVVLLCFLDKIFHHFQSTVRTCSMAGCTTISLCLCRSRLLESMFYPMNSVAAITSESSIPVRSASALAVFSKQPFAASSRINDIASSNSSISAQLQDLYQALGMSPDAAMESVIRTPGVNLEIMLHRNLLADDGRGVLEV